MRVLRKGTKGIDVGKWQYFLHGLGFYNEVVDDDFGNITHEATIKFQKKYKLGADGIVGRKSYIEAIKLGFGDFNDDDNDSKTSVNYPPKPDFPPLKGVQKEQIFGKIEYIYSPSATNKEKVTITNNFEKENIILVNIPQLSKITNGKYNRMRIHKNIKYQMLEMWKEWEEKGLLHLVISYSGAFLARFIRGSRTRLSNHSWGTAMDINVAWNGLGRTPALVGEKGSVRELVEIANKWGLYWGGHFTRKDGMHFEAYKIILKP